MFNLCNFKRVKYEELLSNCNELRSEKMALQQQFERGSSNVKATEANIKVLIIHSNVIFMRHGSHVQKLFAFDVSLFHLFVNYCTYERQILNTFDRSGEWGEGCEAHKRNSKARRREPMFTVSFQVRDLFFSFFTLCRFGHLHLYSFIK